MDGSPALTFGRFELQPRQRRVVRDGQPVPVGPRAFDVLLALAERRERIVTKAELMDLVWPGLVVEENNLQVQISSLRRLLGPNAIATIPGRGYRFTAEVASTRGAGPASQQRLAAILTADVAGYSRLMAVDENATVMALDAARAVFKKRIGSSRARVIDMAGGSVLAVFETATGAVSTALEIQDELRGLVAGVPREGRMLFRIGVHLGEVIEKPDGSVYGDGVNVAARLQALADPGGIALSDAMRWAVKGKTSVDIQDAGEHLVKNIAEPLRVFKLALPGSPSTPPSVLGGGAGAASRPSDHLPLPDKPSIAVLPFSNMSADPEQEYFCDGISDDLITELSRFHSLFVISRHSSFTYKGRAVDVRTVSKELGVRYVLEGSARRAGTRLRLTAQLIDAITGAHLWAEKYDREVTQIFDIQEELTRRIVVSIAPSIEEAERERVRRHPQDLGAYEIGVRAMAKAHQGYRSNDPKILDEAMSDASTALRIDPGSVIALGALAFCRWQRMHLVSDVDAVAEWQEGISVSTRAIEADRNDCLGYVHQAMLLAFAPKAERRVDALTSARRAFELNPNDMVALLILAFVEALAGHTAGALEHLNQVMRISPRDPMRFGMCNQFAMTCFLAGRYAEGAEYAAQGIQEAPTHGTLHGWLAMNCVGLDDLPRAHVALAEAKKFAPAWVESRLAGGFSFRDKEQLARATSFLRIAAGLQGSN